MKENCIFITGPESSGSTLVAKIIAQVLGNPTWSGRGFNCCDDAQCDADNGYINPCRKVERLVCHRSLPFKHYWPPFDAWKEKYNGKYIICTRDKTICRYSQLTRFSWKDEKILKEEEKKVSLLLDDLINSEDTSTFIWSYETYVLLGKTYLNLLADYLEIPRYEFENFEPPRNENAKYITPYKKRSRLSRLGLKL
jgi:hypothetical protein